jgi:hypothetical protein
VTALRQELRRWVPASLRMRLRPPPQWTVSVLHAASPLSLLGPGVTHTPVLGEEALAEYGLVLAADPFAIERDGRWYLFVETLERGHDAATIGLLTSSDLDSWDYEGTVLREPFHLSYPRVLVDGDDTFLVPESYAADSVRLYRALDFPRSWGLERTLLSGAPFKDATPFTFAGRWWMYVETSRHAHDELRLFHADALLGPWSEHPSSPIVRQDPTAARPAGGPVLMGSTLVRFAQDCGARYGGAVRAFEVLELDPMHYRERPLPHPVIAGTGAGWHAGAAHHVDAHRTPTGWVCFVDGHR